MRSTHDHMLLYMPNWPHHSGSNSTCAAPSALRPSAAVDLAADQSTSSTTDRYTDPTALATRQNGTEAGTQKASDHTALNTTVDICTYAVPGRPLSRSAGSIEIFTTVVVTPIVISAVVVRQRWSCREWQQGGKRQQRGQTQRSGPVHDDFIDGQSHPVGTHP